MAHKFGSQGSTCGINMTYQQPRKLFIYFASKAGLKIYEPCHMQLKNKNIFATMISPRGAHTSRYPLTTPCNN